MDLRVRTPRLELRLPSAHDLEALAECDYDCATCRKFLQWRRR